MFYYDFLNRGKKLNCIFLLLLSLVLSVIPISARQITLDDVRARLQSDFINGLYHRTYYSLLDRIDVDGFLQESLTGRYPGMFPRTVGGAVSLFLETNELHVAEKMIQCTLQAMTVNDMERIPHVFLRQKNDLVPVFNNNELMQSSTPDALYKLGSDNSAAMTFRAPSESIFAIEAAIKVSACRGVLTMTIRKEKESEPLISASLNTDDVTPGQLWQRFQLTRGLKLDAGQEYVIRFDYAGFGHSVWFGIKDEDEKSGGFWQKVNTDVSGWTLINEHFPAFIVDSGHLRHEQRHEPYNIYCDWDQIDGQAHVIMAWARLALQRGRTAFEDSTYPVVATLMDRTSDQPYFMWGRGHAVGVNLVQNISLEHSREGRYWHAWDILTQCVVGASLQSMIDIARQHGDSKHALRWQDRLQVLEKGIKQNLTRIVNNNLVYLEMRLPNSAGGVPFTGMGWMNFAPIMAQWEPLDRQVLRNTVQVMREKLLFDFKNHKYLAMEYDQNGKVFHSIIGKGVGWEIDYARQEKEYDRIVDWLDFLSATHSGEFYTEFMSIDENGKWITGDGGNGEQSSWWCWAMARLRKDVGLPVIDKRPEGY